MSLGTPMREATREGPAPKGKRSFSGRSRKKSRPSLAIAARALRGRFVVEGTGKAEPRSSRRAQAKHRAGDREIAGKNWRNGSTRNLQREGDGMEAYSLGKRAPGNPTVQPLHGGQACRWVNTEHKPHCFRLPPCKQSQKWPWSRRRAPASECRTPGQKSSAQVGIRQSFALSLDSWNVRQREESVNCCDALANPTHDRDRHTVAQRPVAGTVGG